MSLEKRWVRWVLWNLTKRRANLKDKGPTETWRERQEVELNESGGRSKMAVKAPERRGGCTGLLTDVDPVMEWWRRWSEWKTVRGSEWERGIEWETRWKGGGVKLDGKNSSCARLFSQRWHAARTEIERREEPARLWCLPAFSSSNWIRARTALKWGGGLTERWLSLKLLEVVLFSQTHEHLNVVVHEKALECLLFLLSDVTVIKYHRHRLNCSLPSSEIT